MLLCSLPLTGAASCPAFSTHIRTLFRDFGPCVFYRPRRHVGARREARTQQRAAPIMSESFLAAAAERTAEAESDLVELKRGTWATDRVG